MQIYWNRRNRLHKKRVQLPQDWLGTLTWPPFHWFGTSIWPPWRHVKTLYKVFRSLRLWFRGRDPLGQPLRYDVRCVWRTCSSSVPSLFKLFLIAFRAGTKSSPMRIFASWIFLIFRRLVLLWKRIAWPGNNARVHLFSFTRRGKSTIFKAESGHLGDKQKVPITSWSGQRLSCGYGDILPLYRLCVTTL